MRTMLLATLLLTSAHMAAAGNDWTGYGGPNGQRVYPDARPPASNFKVLWDVPMKTWGHSMPVFVETPAGARIFLTREVGPNNTFPVLVCIDADDGKLLWEHELDHLSAIEGIDADTVRSRLKAYWDRDAELHKIYYEATKGQKNSKGPTPGSDKAHGKEAKELAEIMGLHRDGFRMGPYASGLSCFGDAFATPCSDGQQVYACTTWGGTLAFDVAGNPKWVAYVPGGNWGWNNPGRSPILHKGILYFDAADNMRAIDCKTGEVLWADQKENENSMVSPAVIRVAGQDVLLAAGEQAYLLPEGKKLTVEGWKDNGMQILVKHDEPDVAYFCGSGEHCGWTKKGDTEIQSPACFRFKLEGHALKGEVLWHGGTIGGKTMWGNNAPWMVVKDSKFYHRNGHILDALTGAMIAKGDGRYRLKVPPTTHMLQVAGDHVYGLRKGSFGCYALDGTKASGMKFEQKPLTPEQGEAHEYVCGNTEGWKGKKGRDGKEPPLRFSYSETFTFGGDRIYVRSMYNLMCVGLGQ